MSTGAATQPADAVFRALAQANVRYCLWRGSRRLARAFAGQSDFDLLVDAKQADRLTEVFARQGLRRANSHPSRAVPGVEDWLGLATPRGPLLHYHVHHRLVAGPSTTNHFRLPWEQQVLESRVLSADAPIYLAHPVVESGLLLVRCALQLRARDSLPWSPSGAALARKVDGDLTQLLTGGDLPRLDVLLGQWLDCDGVLSGCLRLNLAAHGPLTVTLAGLRRLRRLVVRSIGHLAAMPGATAALRSCCHDARSALRLVARGCGLPLLPNRSGLTGGVLVALEDQDGTHAPALAEALRQLFDSKLDVFVAGTGRRALRRAQQGRAAGMLAIVATRNAALDLDPAPDLVLAMAPPSPPPVAPPGTGSPRASTLRRIDLERDPEAALATAIQAVWNRL